MRSASIALVSSLVVLALAACKVDEKKPAQTQSSIPPVKNAVPAPKVPPPVLEAMAKQS